MVPATQRHIQNYPWNDATSLAMQDTYPKGVGGSVTVLWLALLLSQPVVLVHAKLTKQKSFTPPRFTRVQRWKSWVWTGVRG